MALHADKDTGTLARFCRYIEAMTGTAVFCTPLPDVEQERSPLFLRALYRLYAVELFGRRWLAAVAQAEPDDVPPPGELCGHAEQLRAGRGAEVALVLPWIDAYTRNRLIRQAVPFIVPGRQVFLPTAWLDLRESYPRRPETPRQFLSGPAQALVLHHLLKEPAEGRSLRELAGRLGYSAMTLSKVADELVARGVCAPEAQGRRRTLRFAAAGRGLWEKVRPHLRSPVRARHWVRWEIRPETARDAGLTALASLTLVGDDERPAVAMREYDYRRLLESGHIVGCPGPEEASAQVECWEYDPARLGSADRVDPLSLVLSLADSQDERVRQALRRVEEAQW